MQHLHPRALHPPFSQARVQATYHEGISVALDSVTIVLAGVIDPEIHRLITELNMVSPEDITTDGPPADTKIFPTTAGCLLRNTIVADAKSALDTPRGVEDTTVEVGVMNDEQKKVLREKPSDGRLEKEIPFAQSSLLTCVIAMTSGRGGIGKSSITANFVAAMAKSRLEVGAVDIDIYGLSIPHMLDVTHEPQVIGGVILLLLDAQGVEIMSIGMFMPDGQSVIWCDPTLHHASRQFLADVFWSDLDVPFIDMPPGTGDVAISITQLLLSSRILVVTTPQVVAAEVAERAGSITSQTQQRVVDVAENMSCLSQPDGFRLGLFGSGGSASVSACLSAQLGCETPLLARVLLDTALCEGGDADRPAILDGGPISQTLSELAEKLSIVKRGLNGRPLGTLPVQK